MKTKPQWDTTRYHLDWPKFEKKSSGVEDVEKSEPTYIADGMWNGSATVESNWKFLKKSNQKFYF